MAIILESFDIDSPQHGKPFRVDFAEGLDGPHIDFMEAEWTPAMRRQYELALLNFFQLPEAERTEERWRDVSGELAIQDHHWSWRTKCSIASGTNRRVFSLLNAGEVEAAMVLRFGKVSRDTSGTFPLVYVDFVAVAPWNRKAVQNPQRFCNLGSVMLGAAVELSRIAGFNGRCGLHSLPQSEGFYRRIGMRDLGLDPEYSSLRYFEFDATTSAAYFRR